MRFHHWLCRIAHWHWIAWISDGTTAIENDTVEDLFRGIECQLHARLTPPCVCLIAESSVFSSQSSSTASDIFDEAC